MGDPCIRCGEAPGVDDYGYCGHCHWVAKAEVSEGFLQLSAYLERHEQFEIWCRDHGWDSA